ATGKVVDALWPSGGLPAEHVAFTPDGKKLVALCERTEPGVVSKKQAGQEFRVAVGKSKKLAQVSVWDVATRKELGHPVETNTTDRSQLPTYMLNANGRFVLKTQVLLPQPPDEESKGTPLLVRFTVIDALTGVAGKPIDLN